MSPEERVAVLLAAMIYDGSLSPMDARRAVGLARACERADLDGYGLVGQLGEELARELLREEPAP